MNENTYASVVMRAVMQKLLENFCLTITRGEEFLTWTMEQLLQAFLKELDLRENHFHATSSSKVVRDNHMKGGTANALHTKQDNMNCAFCLGIHAFENCQKIEDSKECKSIVMKYAR